MFVDERIPNIKTIGKRLSKEKEEKLEKFYKNYMTEIIEDGKKKYGQPVQINLDFSQDSDNVIDRYIVDELNGRKLEVGIFVCDVNLDRLRRAYDKNEKTIIDKYKLLTMLCLNNEELENFERCDETINKYRDTIREIRKSIEESKYNFKRMNLIENLIVDSVMKD